MCERKKERKREREREKERKKEKKKKRGKEKDIKTLPDPFVLPDWCRVFSGKTIFKIFFSNIFVSTFSVHVWRKQCGIHSIEKLQLVNCNLWIYCILLELQKCSLREIISPAQLWEVTVNHLTPIWHHISDTPLLS